MDPLRRQQAAPAASRAGERAAATPERAAQLPRGGSANPSRSLAWSGIRHWLVEAELVEAETPPTDGWLLCAVRICGAVAVRNGAAIAVMRPQLRRRSSTRRRRGYRQ